MTLIAAYRPHGVPILLGDFLITGGGTESSRKKIHKIGPNFVVGWTGRRILAAPILKSLHEKFGGKFVTTSEVHDFLTSRPEEELKGDELYLIGWVVDESPDCFLWNIAYPTELFYEPYHVAGSGEAKFRELIMRKSFGGSWGSRRSNVDQAIYSALAKATELYSDEVLERMNRKQGFGYAYEMLYFHEGEFRYLDNVAFLGMDILLNPADWTGGSRPYDVWYRYHSLGDASFLQVTNLRTGDMNLEVINPAFDQPLSDAAFEFTAGSFRSNYYCIFLRLQTTEGDFHQGSLVLAESKDGPSLYEKQENGKTSFELGRDLIKFIYENMKAEREHHKVNSIRWGWGAAETVQRITKVGSGIRFQVGQADKCAVVGLTSAKEWDQNYNTIDYAIMCCPDATIQIYEKGTAVGPLGSGYTIEDIFGIAVEDINSRNIVRYYQNDDLLYTSSIEPELPLRGAASMYEEGATIRNCQIYTPS